MQVKELLEKHYPQLEVNGGNYPTPASKVLLANALHVVQLGVIGLVVAGEYLFTNVLNYPVGGPFPPFYESIKEKKLLVGFGAWMVGNSLAQSLTSTGAFEIAYNGQMVYSKLASSSAQLPTLQQIITNLQQIDPNLISQSAHSGRYRKPTQPISSKRTSQSSYSDNDYEDEHDRDTNSDIHDLAYDEDRSR
jgi:selT/selW/selH-like putative selenoprotein